MAARLPRPIPFAPLERAVTDSGHTILGGSRHANREWAALRRAYFRAKERGCMDVFTADRLALTLADEHPALIWPKEWRHAG